MSDTLAFDTHAAVKELEAAGFSERQAETLIQRYVRFMDGHLATKADVAAIHPDNAAINLEFEALRQEIQRGLKLFREEFKQALNESEQRIINRLGGMIIAQTALLTGIELFA